MGDQVVVEVTPPSANNGSDSSACQKVESKDSIMMGESNLDLCLLPSSFTDDELEHHLRSILSHYGTITSTKATRDKKLRPFCFVQFSGVVESDMIFTQPHYLGGRALRIEKSRVKSNELAASRLPPSSSCSTFFTTNTTTTINPSIATTITNDQIIAIGSTITPTIEANGGVLMVFGLRGRQASRKLIFQRFKRYGYVLGIDLQWRPNSPDKVAYIYYETTDAAQRARIANDGQEWLGQLLYCETTIIPLNQVYTAAGAPTYPGVMMLTQSVGGSADHCGWFPEWYEVSPIQSSCPPYPNFYSSGFIGKHPVGDHKNDHYNDLTLSSSSSSNNNNIY